MRDAPRRKGVGPSLQQVLGGICALGVGMRTPGHAVPQHKAYQRMMRDPLGSRIISPQEWRRAEDLASLPQRCARVPKLPATASQARSRLPRWVGVTPPSLNPPPFNPSNALGVLC